MSFFLPTTYFHKGRLVAKAQGEEPCGRPGLGNHVVGPV